ncbi:hypothetical protein C8R42DRAFT_646303 [Lentinula raphanica]|nr:hypothetical protein C8R42DRAFT_646303 [Lentinula raphanica]
MPRNQKHCEPGPQTITRKIRARIYQARSPRPETRDVLFASTLLIPHREMFLVSEELSGSRQRHIHDTIVDVRHRGKRYSFRIFYKRHKKLPRNRAVRESAKRVMDGDILVVAFGPESVRVTCAEDSRKRRTCCLNETGQTHQPFQAKRFPNTASL